MADDVKQVKVDNWGVYFLQRLKHFFNRTDYCDLTLQFQDNAQLKVHRLVLSACTEYFELLERTCEMYEDCLVMPDDLQADIVVPIVNFMYTGQLEFKMELLERLHQCSEIMNMPVLTKLLDSHRPKARLTHNYNPVKRANKQPENRETIKSLASSEIVTTTVPYKLLPTQQLTTYKRSYNKAFEKTTVYRDKSVYLPKAKTTLKSNGPVRTYREPSPIPLDQRYNKKVISGDPRPTRYELPDELDTENVFENSFTNISYTSQPLMVHPETRKQYAKRPRLQASGEASCSKKSGPATLDIVDCRKPIKEQEALFEDIISDDTAEIFPDQFINVKAESSGDSNQLFDQMLDKNEEDSKVIIESKNKVTANLDHAKIISEVLKKYPHLVKSNKNIKLKILNTPARPVRKQRASPSHGFDRQVKAEKEPDFTFETDVLDSKQAAKLIALGAENIDGPWICLICGTPGKAMNFTSYYKFRRHLVEVHREKPVLNICEFCGQKSSKRNYILHHLYTKHGVEPPATYNFPKCNLCNYVALTEALLQKHKFSHTENKNFRCNVCPIAFHSSNQLLAHIQSTGHKYTADRKSNLQCIYCQKVFMRESNLCAHLKAHHKKDAIKDNIIDDSDDDLQEDKKNIVKTEPTMNDYQELDIQYQIQQRPDGNITVVTKKAHESSPMRQKILNAGLSTQVQNHNRVTKTSTPPNEYIQEVAMPSNDTHEEVVMIDNNEYIMRENQLIPRISKQASEEYILSDHNLQPMIPTTSMGFPNVHNSNVQDDIQHANMLLKSPGNMSQSIPIYVSNEEQLALMASNQPIIFDSNDSNKTLTVLTAPHASTLENTTIGLDTTQSNNMMIIQDEFPLNVSEAVASENSNIVVVYSHQVGDQGKQYQLLTTQGLGAQFVQSSAMLSQNFETVTTTAPIMNAHVLEKQVGQDWQNNLQHIIDTNQIEITPVSSVQAIVEQTNQVQVIDNAESNNDISESQEELLSNVSDIANNSTDITPVSQCQEIVAEEMPTAENLMENTVEEAVDDAQNMSSVEVYEEGTMEHPVEGPVDPTITADVVVEDITEPEEGVIPNNTTDTDTVIEETEYAESPTFTQNDQDSQSTLPENVDDIQQQSDETVIESQSTEDENVQISNEEQLVSEPNVISDCINETQQALTEDTTGKAETLASEWSEEDSQDREKEGEVEESIENIQHEVKKHMTERRSSEQNNVAEINVVPNLLQDQLKDEQEKAAAAITDPVVAHEKISSLLNDWEDNNSDSEHAPAEAIAIAKPVPIETVIGNTTIKRVPSDNHDKIKSLVSDWDEDEEDNKD